MAPIVRAAFNRSLIPAFRTWFQRYEQDLRTTWDDRLPAFMESYSVDEATWQAFWNASAEAAVRITLTDNPDEASLKDHVFTNDDLAANRSTLEAYLKAMLARQLYGSRAAYPLFNEIDMVFQEALKLWAPAEDLAENYTTASNGGPCDWASYRTPMGKGQNHDHSDPKTV